MEILTVLRYTETNSSGWSKEVVLAVLSDLRIARTSDGGTRDVAEEMKAVCSASAAMIRDRVYVVVPMALHDMKGSVRTIGSERC